MSLNRVQRLYEQLGQDDPFWAVLTEDRLRRDRWDPEELLADGKREIAEVMQYLEALDLTLRRTSSIDGPGAGGCGCATAPSRMPEAAGSQPASAG